MKIQIVGGKLLVMLICYCVVIFVGIALLACLCAALLVFFKNGIFVWGWKDDVVYSVKLGIAAGVPAGGGVWIISKIEERKEKGSGSGSGSGSG